MIQAIYGAHELNGQIIEFFDKIVAECGKEKHEYEHFDIRKICGMTWLISLHGSYGRSCIY